jgi:hypothetical protein
MKIMVARFVYLSLSMTLLLLHLVGCQVTEQLPTATTQLPTATAVPSATATATSLPTNTAPAATETSPAATPTDNGSADFEGGTPAEPLADLTLLPEKLHIYPVPQLYSGDQVTFQLVAYVPPIIDPANVMVNITANGTPVVQDRLFGRNLGGETVGLYTWAWDTTNLQGDVVLEFALDPENLIDVGDEDPANNIYSTVVTVEPARNRPVSENEQEWVLGEGSYADIYVVTGTPAHRDLKQLIEATDSAFAAAIERLGLQPQRRYTVYFINRVIGQGGYASSSIVVTYNDRRYSGGDIQQVLVHEAVHLLDQQIAPNRVSFLAEGMAVWAAGGHYKPENLDTRSAALIETGLYVPLAELADNFYPIQHEIGYLEAAGFVNYLVAQYGWPAVRDFYASTELKGYSSVSAALDANLQAHFGKTLNQLEQEWQAYLKNVPYDPKAAPDLLTTVRFYNVMRRYQMTYDPTAHFLVAWLPYPSEMRERGITADLTRHPESEMNIVLEVMLHAADIALRTGDYEKADVLISSVERVLDSGNFLDPLALSYKEIVQKATTAGYEVQRIEMNGNEAAVFVNTYLRPTLTQLNFARTQSAWILLR